MEEVIRLFQDVLSDKRSDTESSEAPRSQIIAHATPEPAQQKIPWASREGMAWAEVQRYLQQETQRHEEEAARRVTFTPPPPTNPNAAPVLRSVAGAGAFSSDVVEEERGRDRSSAGAFSSEGMQERNRSVLGAGAFASESAQETPGTHRKSRKDSCEEINAPPEVIQDFIEFMDREHKLRKKKELDNVLDDMREQFKKNYKRNYYHGHGKKWSKSIEGKGAADSAKDGGFFSRLKSKLSGKSTSPGPETTSSYSEMQSNASTLSGGSFSRGGSSLKKSSSLGSSSSAR
eukprot:CAMPEP_0181335528 /NCGR_PEP_ID=MMETSP1101-20121128/26886_1 /TAXON_ID=46948 /ORGANISM="Rhodomonas abbreviata, Strain Caron Lab Isolate" /LENGTH=288 /DNA_ID=CAMNT_0023445667 /DNA_START=60 /DNA_END=926 /DNA_ORIENTATION=+